MSIPPAGDLNPASVPPSASATLCGRWRWGFGILLIACIAQGVFWTIYWEDPTHFKMSVLFVWPAALFALTIWWVFFSGWSWIVRLGCVAAVVSAFAGFLSVYRVEFDGDMAPHRVVLRSTPTAEQIAREFLKTQSAIPATAKDHADETSAESPTPLVAVEGDWLGFRGARRDGVVVHGSLRRNWDTAPPRQIWRHPIGRAWSAFAVVGGYAITQEQRDENECVVAYDAETGDQIWIHQDKAMLSIVEVNGGPGPHATPQFDDGRIYAMGGTGLLNCLDARTGKSLWSTNILKDAGDGSTPMNPPQWGVSFSPLVVDDLVIVIPGGKEAEGGEANDKGLIAYDKKTGQLVWAFGKHPASYGSPSVETIAGTKTILMPNGDGLSGHAIDSGKELWFFPLVNSPKVNSAMPWLLDQNSLLFGTGYGVGSVRLDIKNEGTQWKVSSTWSSNRFRPKFNDFVVVEGHAYGLDDGTLACLDVASGKIKWKSGRYGYGQLLLIDDVLLILSEDGELVLVPATTTKSEPLASFKVFENSICWNHLAFVRGRLFVRNANEGACFDVGEQN